MLPSLITRTRQKIKFFKKTKLFLKKKKKYFVYKNLKHLKFILKRLNASFFFQNHYYLLTRYKNDLIIYHNKNFHFFFLKNYLTGSKQPKIIKNLTYLKNNSIIIDRKLKLKKKKFLNIKKTIKYKNVSFISILFNKILTTTFNNGKKSNWYLILNNLFEYLAYLLNYSISILLSKIFMRLFTRVELRKVVARKRITYIPFFIKTNRSVFLSLKWIFLSVSKNTNKISLQNKLYLEFFELLTNQTCFSILKLEENNSESFNHRANVHFRWQKTR